MTMAGGAVNIRKISVQAYTAQLQRILFVSDPAPKLWTRIESTVMKIAGDVTLL